jgi:hypothetical protein
LPAFVHHEKGARRVQLNVEPDTFGLSAQTRSLSSCRAAPVSELARQWEALLDAQADIRTVKHEWQVV